MKMSKPIDVGLKQIKTLLQKMGGLAMDSIKLSVEAFNKQEDAHIQIEAWSNMILILSEEVEDKATELMALHQPMAKDLRTLRAYIKIAYDIERFGRYALDISEIHRTIGPWKTAGEGPSIDELSGRVARIVALALSLMEVEDQSVIWELASVESEIDSLYIKNLKALIEAKDLDPKRIIAYALTIRYLERIADHACYIAESMTYAYTGKRITLR
ncbi:MAG: PhoU domain-containing protein [Candidatus Bathyarchaeia archaeon]